MFIMINAYESTHPQDLLEVRIAEALASAGSASECH